jgi:6-phosphogluconolactonase (cycloisomerase 2 family)
MKCRSTGGFKLAPFLFALASALAAAGCGPTNGLPPLTGEFLYVSNSQDAVVSEFTINIATGQLSFLAQFVSEAGATTAGLAIHPSNEFLYDAASFPDNVVGMDIGDGSFSGMIFARNGIAPAIDGPSEIALDPPGRCAYVTNMGGTAAQVSRYFIDQSSGTLTSLGSSTAGQIPFGVAVKPDGSVVLVVNLFDQTVSDFKTLPRCVLEANNTLNLATTAAALGAATPELVAFHPTLPNAYVTDDGLDLVYELAINPDLTVSLLGTVQPSPVEEVQPEPFSIVIDPTGRFLYTGSTKTGVISEFTIGATGLLTFESNETTGCTSPISLAIDSTGQYLYAANVSGSTVAMFSINSTTGALSPIGTPNTIDAESPANPGSGPFSAVATH